MEDYIKYKTHIFFFFFFFFISKQNKAVERPIKREGWLTSQIDKNKLK
jgi:hypothetical protein